MAIYRHTAFEENVTDLDNAAYCDGHLLQEDGRFHEQEFDGTPVVIMSTSGRYGEDDQPPLQLCLRDHNDVNDSWVVLKIANGPKVRVQVAELIQAIALSSGNWQVLHSAQGVHIMRRTQAGEDGRYTEPYGLTDAVRAHEAALEDQRRMSEAFDHTQDELLAIARELGIDLGLDEAEREAAHSAAQEAVARMRGQDAQGGESVE